VKTIRQRRPRARRGQVSAVAVLLGLLLVVTYIANYLGQALPSQMQEYEFEHTLQVENQLGRIQTDILAQASNPKVALPLTSPVTLGSESVPPFAPASTGSVALDPTSFSLRTQYTIARILPAPPSWGVGNLCTTLTGVSCGNTQSNLCSPPLDYNLSVSNVSFTYDLTGSNDCERLNLTGSNDTMNLQVTGSNLGYFVLTLFGFNDVILLTNHFSGSGFHSYFYLYGAHDTYEAVGGPTGSNSFLNTYFVGEEPTGFCPADNVSATDSWSISGSSASNSIQNFTWYNSVGYASPYVQTNGWPGAGNSGSGDHVGWQNLSTPIACAFTQAFPSTYTSNFNSGLRIHLANRYNSPEDIVYEDGAVILSHAGSGSFMTGPPSITVSQTLLGAYVASLTIVSLVPALQQNGTVEQGTSTVGVSTSILGVHAFKFANNPSAGYELLGIWLYLTTPYPSAWAGFLGSLSSEALVGSVGCTTATLPGGYTCLVPPAGQVSTLSAELLVSALDFTAITVAVSIQ
jgi:hypothetical protein